MVFVASWIFLFYLCVVNPIYNTLKAEEILEKGGVKPTSNRLLIVGELMRINHPVSIMELADTIDTIDKSGVFRVLTLLLDHGIVHAVEDGRGIVKYELCTAGHDGDNDMHAHFYCQECHKVECLGNIAAPKVEIPQGYELRSVNYMLKGLCPQCAAKKNR